jgi:hypothetical protein
MGTRQSLTDVEAELGRACTHGLHGTGYCRWCSNAASQRRVTARRYVGVVRFNPKREYHNLADIEKELDRPCPHTNRTTPRCTLCYKQALYYRRRQAKREGYDYDQI